MERSAKRASDTIRYDTSCETAQCTTLRLKCGCYLEKRESTALDGRAAGRPAGGDGGRAGGPRAANGMDRTALHGTALRGTRGDGRELRRVEAM